MTQDIIELGRPNLAYAKLPIPPNSSCLMFLDACRDNDVALALQLAPDDVGVLTWGLNRAVEMDHLNLASQLLGVGARWDMHTVYKVSKSLDKIRWLVESGFDVNTNLHGAAVMLNIIVRHNDEVSIRYLLEQGADPNLGPPPDSTHRPLSRHPPVSNSGWTLNIAVANCTLEILNLLISYGINVSHGIPLHYAAGYGIPEHSRIPILDRLVGLGLDINAVDDAIKIGEFGQGQHGTPLQYALLWGRLEVCKWLLENGADPDKKSPWGRSARDDFKGQSDRHGPGISRPFLELLKDYDNSMLSQAGV
ncbi:ankyrin repeat-containing domain protein [Dendryphion nanum]|uniref:Ankyrin repeat-containing domain protein n=1 Tax=Dendryphion nanum TaxID=256645 RepID=A0A9P9DB97_9PLEO|nr:ankyrin repeat-containing domain protein [Dendryphion nanum]